MMWLEVPMDDLLRVSVACQRGVDMLRRQHAHGHHDARGNEGRKPLTTGTRHPGIIGAVSRDSQNYSQSNDAADFV